MEDLKASIFAGEWSHADLQGVCGQFPQCENCLLLQTCNWSAQKNGFLDKNTIETRIQKGRWDTLKTEELTEWLLEDHDLQESWMNLEGVTEFRLKSIDHPKLLE